MRVVQKRGNFMSKLLAKLLMALAATVGVYAIASTATSLATFHEGESKTRIDVAEFVGAVKWAAAAHRKADANCELLTGTERTICDAAGRSEQRRIRAVARAGGNVYSGYNTHGIHIGTTGTVGARYPARDDNVMPEVVPDVALYRAHRQLPDAQLGCFATDETSVSRKRVNPRKNWPQIAMK